MKLTILIIRSTNLYEDSAVELITEEKSDLEYENGMVIFSRPITKKVLKAIDDYNRGIKINVLQFSQTLKRRRAEMHMRKSMGGRNE